MDKILMAHAQVSDHKAHIVTGAIVVLLSLFLIFYAIPYQIAVGLGARGVVTPRTLPYYTSFVMLFCGIYVLFDGFRRKRNLAKYQESPQFVDFSLLAIIITLIGFFFAGFIREWGYPLSNVLAMLAIYYIFGGRKLWVGLTIGIVFTAFSWLFFVVYLNLSIPLGFGF